MFKRLIILCSSLLLMPACVHNSPSKNGLAYLEIGMTKRQVRNIMKSDGASRGSLALPDGSIQETIVYDIYNEIGGGQHAAHAILTVCCLGLWAPIWLADALEGNKEVFWMTFINGKLTQYGHPCDWKTPADHIQEFRLR